MLFVTFVRNLAVHRVPRRVYEGQITKLGRGYIGCRGDRPWLKGSGRGRYLVLTREIGSGLAWLGWLDPDRLNALGDILLGLVVKLVEQVFPERLVVGHGKPFADAAGLEHTQLWARGKGTALAGRVAFSLRRLATLGVGFGVKLLFGEHPFIF